MYTLASSIFIYTNISTYSLGITSLKNTVMDYNNINKQINKQMNNKMTNTQTTTTRIRAINRIGPHNIDVLSLIYGALLGDGHAEKREQGKGTRITFYQENSHIGYLLFIHKFLFDRGYSSEEVPVINTRLGIRGKVRKVVRCRT